MGHVEKDREELLEDLAREVRQFNGLGASFFRAVAGRVGMNATDVQVVDILDITGPVTARRLAELTGLTTGAITQMLDRLEETGRVRRERDPEDGRRVIVELVPGENATRGIAPIFESIGTRWDEIASRYDEAQLAVLVEFLKHANEVSREELARLREAPEEGEGRVFSAPLGDLASARLVVSAGISGLTVRAGERMAELYQACFEGAVPDVKVEKGAVTMRYPRRLWVLGGKKRTAEVTLNAAIPWQIVIQGGASDITAELGHLDLAGLEVKGGASMIRLELPAPSGTVPIQISGGASDITVRRPAGVAARAHLKGWASAFVFDHQSFSNVGNDVRLQSPGYEATDQRYDIEVSSSASTVRIISD